MKTNGVIEKTRKMVKKTIEISKKDLSSTKELIKDYPLTTLSIITGGCIGSCFRAYYKKNKDSRSTIIPAYIGIMSLSYLIGSFADMADKINKKNKKSQEKDKEEE